MPTKLLHLRLYCFSALCWRFRNGNGFADVDSVVNSSYRLMPPVWPLVVFGASLLFRLSQQR